MASMEACQPLRSALSALRSTINQPSRTSPRCLSRRSRARFSTGTQCRQQEVIKAAPEINLASRGRNELALFQRLRIVPASPSYFSSKPIFTDDLLTVSTLLRKYQHLPQIPSASAPRVSWKRLEEYKALCPGEPVSAARFSKLVEMLRLLNRIHPSLMPEDVIAALPRFKRDIQPALNLAKPAIIDEFGRARGLGRRKTSTARAWVVEGDGQTLVNGKSLSEMFGRIHDRESALWALKATDRVDKYNVFALVEGGGTTGQAEALTLAVAKALLVHEPLLKPALRRAGCITRDPRKVERKKTGHVKARKMPTWVKR